MTLPTTSACTGVPGPPVERASRVLLKIEASKTGYVDGAWWPYTDELGRELPALLAVLTGRLGPIHRVAYRQDEWAKTSSELEIAGRAVRLDGHRYGTVHAIEALGERDRRLVLLVIPPFTDAHRAFATMASASATNNESAVDELMTISVQERSDRTKRVAAVWRWISDGRAYSTVSASAAVAVARVNSGHCVVPQHGSVTALLHVVPQPPRR
ncbi:DUF5994 family protein [Nocardia vaccinii]|uniref:DUF5994 family protein n=1 Tax=Nocardia vaccinii TaxID=1822 RepID=UPI000ACD2808|nr:DUF5994 family protein [Nocardia vaccinii]